MSKSSHNLRQYNFLVLSPGPKNWPSWEISFLPLCFFSRGWFAYIVFSKCWQTLKLKPMSSLFTQMSVFFPILLLCSWNMTFVQSQTLKWKCFKVYRSQTTENNLPICVQNDVKMRHNVSRNWKCKKSFSNLKSWEHNWSSTYLCDRLTVWPSRTLYISLLDAFGSP